MVWFVSWQMHVFRVPVRWWLPCAVYAGSVFSHDLLCAGCFCIPRRRSTHVSAEPSPEAQARRGLRRSHSNSSRTSLFVVMSHMSPRALCVEIFDAVISNALPSNCSAISHCEKQQRIRQWFFTWNRIERLKNNFFWSPATLKVTMKKGFLKMSNTILFKQ